MSRGEKKKQESLFGKSRKRTKTQKSAKTPNSGTTSKKTCTTVLKTCTPAAEAERGQQVDFTVGGFEYTGTLIGASEGVVVVQDPFELNFIATQEILVATVAGAGTDNAKGKGKDKGTAVTISCETPVPRFIALLKSLVNTPVLIQVQSTFLQGAPLTVSGTSQLLVLSTGTPACPSTSTVRIQDISVVLVPLVTILARQSGITGPSLAFGDPTTIRVINNSQDEEAVAVAVFQKPSAL
jgi:hypothetical protein